MLCSYAHGAHHTSPEASGPLHNLGSSLPSSFPAHTSRVLISVGGLQVGFRPVSTAGSHPGAGPGGSLAGAPSVCAPPACTHACPRVPGMCLMGRLWLPGSEPGLGGERSQCLGRLGGSHFSERPQSLGLLAPLGGSGRTGGGLPSAAAGARSPPAAPSLVRPSTQPRSCWGVGAVSGQMPLEEPAFAREPSHPLAPWQEVDL